MFLINKQQLIAITILTENYMRTLTFTVATTTLILLFILVFNPCNAQSTASPDTVCAGSSVSYSISGTPGSSFLWIVAGGTKVSGGNSDSIRVNWSLTPGLDTLKVVEFNVIGCPGDTIKLAVVRLTPPTVAIAGTDSICINSSTVASKLKMTFTGFAPWTVTYTEDGTPRNITTSANPYTFNSQVFNAAGAKPYAVTMLQDRFGCAGTQSGSATVTVFPKPNTSAIRRY